MVTLNRDLFRGRDFISLNNFTAEEISHMIDVALELKAERKNGIPHRVL